MSNKVLILVGPTAIGKTDLSIVLARQLACEIVSADSRQVYNHMDIGTAKPAPGQLAAVPHHFINIRNPDEYYSAGQYAREARSVISRMLAGGSPVLVVGGSGLYIKALIDGFFEPPIADPKVKKNLQVMASERGLTYLYDRLKRIDPVTAGRLFVKDKQRILRALEVSEITGRPFSEFIALPTSPARFESVFVALTMNRQKLYQRIEHRVDRMIQDGLLPEVRNLLELGYKPELNALKTVGYQEVFAHLSGSLSHQEMVAVIKQKTRNYAKRQFTWFRKDKRMHWLDLDEILEFDALVDHVLQRFRQTEVPV